MNLKKKLSGIDYWLLAAVCVISIFGIICICSATQVNLGRSMGTFISQIVWFVVGLGLLTVVLFIDYESFSRYYLIFYALIIILLVIVLLLPADATGTKRWIRFGPVGIQPSEFSKLIIIFCLAKLISQRQGNVNSVATIAMAAAFALFPVLLISRQPSLSASLVVLAILAIELFAAGLSYKVIAAALGVGVPSVGFLIWDAGRENHILIDKIFDAYQIGRIETYLDPASNPATYYQTMKSINALGAGRLSGNGLFQGTFSQLNYLPESHNDFIFAVIGEEFGFVGCMFVIGLMFFIIFRCILIAMTSRDFFSQLVAAGVAGMLAFQTFVNIGVATGVMPNTGMPLPFISYGGSSMLMNMLAIGLVLNIGMKRSKSLFEGV